MDSKRFNIYAGSILGAVLLFLLLNFFSGLIYTGAEHAGHEEEVLAFAVPVEEPAAEGEAPEEPDWAELVATVEPADGERVFNKCQACHTVEQGEHGVGPSLWGVVGSDIASTEGFAYSEALLALEGEWTLEKLAAFLEDPRGYAPGTKMNFAGIPDVEDRVAVIEYLNEAGGSPIELVTEEMAAAAEPETVPAEAEPAAEGEEAAEGEPAAEAEQAAEGEQAAEATEQEAQEAGETAEGEEPAETEGAEGGEYAALLADASAESGEKVFRKCQACHTLDEGKHRVGPSLHGVIGRDIGSAEGYNYSDAMAAFEGTWTLENLMGYLETPNDFIPGNKMTFPGLKDAQERIDVFTYIDQADGERDLPQ